MDAKLNHLKELGFSDEFLSEIEKSVYKGEHCDSDVLLSGFEIINDEGTSLTNYIIDKSDAPVNVYCINKE